LATRRIFWSLDAVTLCPPQTLHVLDEANGITLKYPYRILSNVTCSATHERISTRQNNSVQNFMCRNRSLDIFSVPKPPRQLTQGTALTKTAVTCVYLKLT